MPSDLIDSDLLASEEVDVGSYLYKADSNPEAVFSHAQEEMAQLNDFCLLCLEGTAAKLNDFRRELSSYRMGERQAEHPEIGDITEEVAMGLEDVIIPSWEETEEFLVRAMCLILLSAFLEKSLKQIANYLTPEVAPKFKAQPGLGEIGSLLAYLQVTCLLQFEEPEESKSTRERCRKLRNAFAHGHWDQVKVDVATQSVRQAFSAVSGLLDCIEKARLEQTSP